MPFKKSLPRSWAASQVALSWDPPGLLAGVDEAGRGPLAGPVVAAAVILDDMNPISGLNDSKKLSERKRDYLALEIKAKALCFSIAQATVEEIDALNILQATMLAMSRAVAGLRLKPAKALIDGNRIPKLDMLAEAIVQGDAKVACISAASILAKTTRDALMCQLHQQYPQYAFETHKGYGTAAHIAALREHGACPAHRRSFKPVEALDTAVRERLALTTVLRP
ncbi:MAG: ribonuclease HII [Burkholderiaceae bacterium]|jgi:ribonuclease HII